MSETSDAAPVWERQDPAAGARFVLQLSVHQKILVALATSRLHFKILGSQLWVPYPVPWNAGAAGVVTAAPSRPSTALRAGQMSSLWTSSLCSGNQPMDPA